MDFRQYFRIIKHYDWWLFGLVFLLLIFSLVIIYSIGSNLDPPDLSRFNKQLIFAGLGLVMFVIFSFIDYRLLSSYAYIFYIIAIIVLLAVLIFGTTIRGTTGWFNFGFFSFQPVEFVKILYLIFIAQYFSGKANRLDSLKNILFSGLYTGILVGLVILQPDLGSALIFMAIWLGLLLVQKIKWINLLIIGVILMLIAGVGWFGFLQDYQKNRILTFVDPAQDPLGTGYNVTQAMIAVGSGNFIGRGLGLGPQSQLNFLPETEADFIFAVIAEELGFLGSGAMLIFFGLFFWRIWLIIKRSSDDFGTLLAAGILILFFTQTLINVGMNMGLMPVTGLPLPFISAGGSSLIASFAMVGILQSIYIRNNLT
ncbi:MAG: rod shape-determining protein RodA [Patescibacteria group bacterium]